MRILRLVIVALVIASAAACGDDSEDDAATDGDGTETTTSTTTSTTTTRPAIDPSDGEVVVVPPADETLDPVLPDDPDVDETPTTNPSERPSAPTSLACSAGSGVGELQVEWAAPTDPSSVTHVRLYVSVDRGPFITNQHLDVSQVDTNRGGGRWGAPVKGLEAGVPLRIAVTNFNANNQESGWYIIDAVYSGPGQPCGGAVLPPPTCTAGCEEDT